ncbi:MAG: hypothetical protein HY735_04140 [Verrucomicrobia bacterium]|nr:hypothetical protein [Verrucomicrobiota bacterium]
MRSRIALWISLVLNLALAAVLGSRLSRREPERPIQSAQPVRVTTTNQVIKTNVVVRRQNFTWQEIESTNYVTFIANLRAIGCPEATIRDIIVAEVNALYDRKRATEIVTPEQQWWRSTPDQQVVTAAMSQMHGLEIERRNLLNQLLGAKWEAANSWEVAAFNVRLDGPVLGSLTPEAKQSLRDLETRFAQQKQEYLSGRQKAGEPVDAAEMARLQEANRKELAKVLSPAQIEEYLLRYSDVAQNLRREFAGFELTSEEFRSIFRARDAAEQQLPLYAKGDDPATVRRREELEKQRDEAAKQAMGPERYQLFVFSQDPIFRQAQAAAEQIGAPPETVLPVYQINQAAEQERQRINSDANLSGEQRAAALAATVNQQQESLRKVLGREAFERYSQGQNAAKGPFEAVIK